MSHRSFTCLVAAAVMVPAVLAQVLQGPSGGLGATGEGERITGRLAFAAPQLDGPRVTSRLPLVRPLAEAPEAQLSGLPELRSPRPLYGQLRLAREKKIHFVLDRSEPGMGLYDRLWLDHNTNLDLADDGPPIEGRNLYSDRRGRNYTEFPVVTRELYYGKDALEPYAFLLYAWYPVEGTLDHLLFTAVSWREGILEVRGEQMRVAVFDEDNDGLFDLTGSSWTMQPEAAPVEGFHAPERRLAPSVPIAVDGIPFKVVSISPEGRLLELESETEDAASRAALAFDPILLEPPRPRSASEPLWVSDLDLALNAAAKQDRRVFVLLTVDWTRSARHFEERTLRDQEVVGLLEGFICYRANADVETALARRFDVTAYPTTLVLDAAGNPVARTVGYRAARGFAAHLREHR